MLIIKEVLHTRISVCACRSPPYYDPLLYVAGQQVAIKGVRCQLPMDRYLGVWYKRRRTSPPEHTADMVFNISQLLRGISTSIRLSVSGHGYIPRGKQTSNSSGSAGNGGGKPQTPSGTGSGGQTSNSGGSTKNSS
ncbi:hypothetical protein IW261DRAFT_1424606 [Armillaria novae-zelandiae]|uniref:Uncharacterized protein n=1 Tax=Armillaria novae-zelandiae TaxID=153914 RepID=A0AA39NUH3_9AGAR|nr:hypothetical protein IW261DRAFT_1424606 [Armillaria novae-zelandiae]